MPRSHRLLRLRAWIIELKSRSCHILPLYPLFTEGQSVLLLGCKNIPLCSSKVLEMSVMRRTWHSSWVSLWLTVSRLVGSDRPPLHMHQNKKLQSKWLAALLIDIKLRFSMALCQDPLCPSSSPISPPSPRKCQVLHIEWSQRDTMQPHWREMPEH